jgi:ketosteroid isomerase-like protein
MSHANVDTIRSAYEAFGRGDVPTVLGYLDPDIHWNEAEGFIYADGNPYVGPDAVLSGVFARLATEWDGFAVAAHAFHDAGDTVVTEGYYTGTYKATGTPVRSQFAHVWTFRDGKIAGFQQYTDTLQFTRAVEGRRDSAGA